MPAFLPNPNFSRDFLREHTGEAGLKNAAEGVRALAEADTVRIMPSGPQAFAVVVIDDEVYVANKDHGGHLAEYGSATSPPYAPLRRAVRAAGLRLEEQGKA